jgi:hypothetical protein
MPPLNLGFLRAIYVTKTQISKVHDNIRPLCWKSGQVVMATPSSPSSSSSLNEEIEKDVVPWLNLAEDLRLLKLDVEV